MLVMDVFIKFIRPSFNHQNRSLSLLSCFQVQKGLQSLVKGLASTDSIFQLAALILFENIKNSQGKQKHHPIQQLLKLNSDP